MSDEDDQDEDQAIENYRAQLAAEAELAAGDLDEIEDHLRVLVAELRDNGLPGAQAIAEACRRLGEPRRVAREHVRVRSHFGAKLSRVRAWSVVALIAPMIAFAIVADGMNAGLVSPLGVSLLFGAIVTVALAVRLSWARPVLLGVAAFWLVPSAMAAIGLDRLPMAFVVFCVAHAGMLAFLAPWRRGELGRGGAALALATWSFGAATFATMFEYTGPDGSLLAIGPIASIAVAACLLATAGGVMRARWGAIVSAGAAVALAAAAIEVASLRFAASHASVMVNVVPILFASGSLAAAVSAVLGWRGARSMAGTWRHVLER